VNLCQKITSGTQSQTNLTTRCIALHELEKTGGACFVLHELKLHRTAKSFFDVVQNWDKSGQTFTRI
jgi:hypothetical protein